MPIYCGSNKIKEVYKDSTPIKEVYNGGDLVYKKNTGIQCWGFVTTTNDPVYVLGEYKVGSVYADGFVDGQCPQILSLSDDEVGCPNYNGVEIKFDYSGETINITDKNFKIYSMNMMGLITEILVEFGSKVGDYAIVARGYRVKTLTETSFTSEIYLGTSSSRTATRTPEKDCFWSKELGFYK